MKTYRFIAASLVVCLASPAWAQLELAKSKNCMLCHAVDKKVVGPGYKEVAAKYAGDKNAVAMLAQKILKGSSGVWGPVPMPANTTVSDTEAKQLAQWILATP